MGTPVGVGSPTLASSLDGEDLVVVLYEQYRVPLLNFCQAILRSRDEAEDAVQQTFLSAFRALRRNVHPIAPKPWLYTIARNCCLTMLRARRPRARAVEDAADPVERLELREAVSELLGDVAELPEEQRSALVMSEVGGLSHAEVAQVLGCDRAKVKSLVFRARESLRLTRGARETPCEEIRVQLSRLRGGSLRRSELRRHLRSCPSCAEYRAQIARQRSRLAALAPLAGLRDWLQKLVPWSSGGQAVGGSLVAGNLGAVQGFVACVAAGVGLGVGGASLLVTGERSSLGEDPVVFPSGGYVSVPPLLEIANPGAPDAPRLVPMSVLPAVGPGERTGQPDEAELGPEGTAEASGAPVRAGLDGSPPGKGKPGGQDSARIDPRARPRPGEPPASRDGRRVERGAAPSRRDSQRREAARTRAGWTDVASDERTELGPPAGTPQPVVSPPAPAAELPATPPPPPQAPTGGPDNS